MFNVFSILKKSAHIFNGKLCQACIGLLQSMYVARSLSVEHYGIIGIILATFAMTNSFFSFKSAGPLMRYLILYKEKGKKNHILTLFLINFVIDFFSKIFVVLVVFIVSNYVGEFILNSSEYKEEIVLYSLVSFFYLFDSFWYVLLHDSNKIKLLGYSPTFYALAKLFIILFMFYFYGKTIESFIYSLLISEFLFFLVKIYSIKFLLNQYYRINIKDIFSIENTKRFHELNGYYRFMLHNYAASSISSLVKDADILILGFFRAENEVGIYRVAKSIASLFSNISSSLGLIVYYDFSKLIDRNQYCELKKIIRKLSIITSIFSVFLVILAYLFGRDLLVLLYSEKFSDAYDVFIIMFIGIMLSLCVFWAPQLILALNKPEIQTKISIINLFVFYALGGVTTYYYGALGTAICMSFIWFLGYFLLMYEGLTLLNKDRLHI